MALILRDEIDSLDIQDIHLNPDESCPVCQHPQSKLLSLFLVNNVAYEVIQSKIPDVPSYEILKNHKNHIKLGRPEEELSLIKTDNSVDVDELNVTNSTIRALTARRLELEECGLAGTDEHIAVVESLYKWTRLKLEVNKRLGENKGSSVNIANIIKVPNNVSNDDVVLEHGNE